MWKPNPGFHILPQHLGNPANNAGFPHFHRPYDWDPYPIKKQNQNQNRRKEVGRFAASLS